MKAKTSLALLGLLFAWQGVDVRGACGEKVAGPAPQVGVLYLEKSRGWVERLGRRTHRDLLSQELVRQALLIAGRDELGLTVRDARLGDLMPSKGDNLPLAVLPGAEGPSPVEIVRGFRPSQTVIARESIRFSRNWTYGEFLVDAEKLSRTGFLEALKKAGFQGRPHAQKADVAVPASVGRLLDEMTFTSQFQAIRTLHEIMRVEGESFAVLGALTRGYANLGVLTEFHWHPAHQVFKARALLYAQRMAARDANLSWARWHKAYALAMVGLPADAIAELEAAKQTKPTDKKDNAVPPWVEIIDSYCHYELQKLTRDKTADSCVELVHLLSYHELEQSACPDQAIEKSLAAVQDMPECYRLHEGICQFGGVAILHRGTMIGLTTAGEKLYARVRAMPDLPEDVRRVVQSRQPGGLMAKLFGGREESSEDEFKTRAKLVAALLASGQFPPGGQPPVATDAKTAQDGQTATASADRGEPSWVALGCLIRELDFVQVWRRASFERYALAVSPDEFLAAAAPLVEEHPYRAFVETHAWEPRSQQKAREELAKVSPDGIEMQSFALCDAVAAADSAKRTEWGNAAMAHSASTDRELGLLLNRARPEDRVSVAKKLLQVSPHSPVAQVCLITYDWEDVQDRAAEWEKTAQPAVLRVFGKTYLALKRTEDAERCMKAALNAAPTVSNYRAMAEMYRELGKVDQWVTTLEKILELPDYGLTHAQVNAEIAWHFMGRRVWEKALPYAEGAAQSYSAWGLLCAAHCYEGLQQWKQAEELSKGRTERYRGDEHIWYFFCKRTGQGDLDTARKVFLPIVLERAIQPGPESDRLLATLYYLLEDQPEKAIALAEKDFVLSNNPLAGLFVALSADELKDEKRRDRALEQIAAKGASYRRVSTRKPRPELIALASLISQDLAKGGKADIDVPAAEKVLATAAIDEEVNFRHFLAKYLDLHGKREQAIEMWKKCAISARFEDRTYTLVAHELLSRGMRVEDFKAIFDRSPPNREKAGESPK